MTTFYLGTHQTGWLKTVPLPLFVSRRRLLMRIQLPRARTRWALDSGGFTELAMYGGWRTSVTQFVDQVRRIHAEVGMMDWAAPQDWMCEPEMLQKTGLTVRDHQRRTLENLVILGALAPEIPWIPVLQGYQLSDYLRHVGDYARAGIDLREEPTVGVGTLCRRSGSGEAAAILHELAGLGLRLHAFGVKTRGLVAAADWIVSADSMGWSYDARRAPPLAGCRHRSCQNCPYYARRWYESVRARIEAPRQLGLAY